MVNLPRNFSTNSLSKRFHLQHAQLQLTTPVYMPLSHLQQQRRLLQWKLVSLLHNCTSIFQIKQVHAQIIHEDLTQCCYVITKLVRMLINLNVRIDSYPSLVFQQVKFPNPFLWTALIRGYTVRGFVSKSIFVYNNMRKEGVSPVSFTFSALFKACGAAIDLNLGTQVHAQTILIGGFSSDLYVGNTMISMYVKFGLLDSARKVFDEMSESDVVSWTELIVAYAKSGDMESANELFNGLPVKDMVAWTAMVTGYAQNVKPKEALDVFQKMQGEGIEIDDITLVGVISACAQLGATKYANWVRDIAEKSKFCPTQNVMVGSALIDMYSKCGNLEEAYKVFEAMNERNVFSYSSMILGYAMHGRAHMAIQLFHDMLKTEIEPNHVTFIGVLTACSHVGMVEQGKQIFAKMEKYFNITPSADHYTCMVDLLGRAGQLDEALELANNMPIKAHGGVWGALLGACKIHANPDIAKIASDHLLELEPDGIGNIILLFNIYSSAGKWEEAGKVRKLMREKGLKKNPGYSWVEGTKGEVHEFFAGDMNHPHFKEIKAALEDLVERLKADGYNPNLSSVAYDLSDEEKKQILMNHSEKLALGYGLLSIRPGCEIKIMKNLRICEDCHLVMCGASQITGREILVRDNMRFHHFRDGTCSCGNFW